MDSNKRPETMFQASVMRVFHVADSALNNIKPPDCSSGSTE